MKRASRGPCLAARDFFQMNTELSGRHWIDGRWKAAGESTFNAENPAMGETLAPRFAEATTGEVDEAMSAARRALLAVRDRDPLWPATLLESIATQIEALGDDLFEAAELETALPRARLTGERARTCGQLRMFAQIVREGSWVEAVIDLADPNRQPSAEAGSSPHAGAARAGCSFWREQFPIRVRSCGGDTASALAGGNPVVVKGHPSHPGTSELFALRSRRGTRRM